ncbi:hypothetical protein cand_006020 [Cryptosporidium andersoni]|uniref:PAN domain-containing protein n=1 Tax=Cryptosporidium andersoni TaxID=117008 RepID=A0A1J4MT57_9CRYT|nr:hypothetical protein cand_006020 [Cryptosporidium andersoni]
MQSNIKIPYLILTAILCTLSKASTIKSLIDSDSNILVVKHNGLLNLSVRDPVDCEYTDFKWSNCICDKLVIIGTRELVGNSSIGCREHVTTIELPCDEVACGQKLLHTSNGIACPSLANIDGSCDENQDYITQVKAKSYEACNSFCNTIINCSYFVLDLDSSICKLYTGSRVCGSTNTGRVTGLYGFDKMSCTQCLVGTWSSFSPCVESQYFISKTGICGEMNRTRLVAGGNVMECPYSSETWTCSLVNSSPCKPTNSEINDTVILKSLGGSSQYTGESKVNEGLSNRSFKIIEISLIIAGAMTALVIFLPLSLIFPTIGVFFYGEKLYCILSGKQLETIHSADGSETTNQDVNEEKWEEDDDLDVEYETEFTIDENRH